jgi:hypothetical protein
VPPAAGCGKTEGAMGTPTYDIDPQAFWSDPYPD